MGIQGLTTFIARNADRSLETFHLHDQCLVIDGNSLAAQLFQNTTKCNSSFGGDYAVYARAIRKFFNALTKCKITPYVIFDGGYEDKKMKTVLKRFSGRIIDASRLNPKNQSKFLVFPLLMKDVFVEVLRSCNVTYTFCELEADSEIAAVARFLGCPVLSYDSDFFVFNVTYIPFPALTLKPSILKTNEGSHYVLKCKLYRVEYFFKLFPGVDNNMLPLIATLLGNDYVKRSVFSKFYDNLKQSKSKKMNEGQRRIVAVIEWLQNESFDSAIEKVLSHYKLTERNKIQKLITGSCANYTSTYCNSLKELGLLTENSTIDMEALEVQIKTTDNDYKNHQWILNILKTGKISPRFYDIIHKSFYIAMPQAEDFTMSDSNLSSLPVLRFSFDIMMGFDKKDMMLECRNGIKQRSRSIPYTAYIPDELIDSWVNRRESPGPAMFYGFLEKTMEKETIEEIKRVPGNLQMLVLTILWMRNSSSGYIPVPNESQIYSLILSCINLSLVRTKIAGDYSSYEFNSKYSEEIQGWCDTCKERQVKVVPGFEGINEKNICYEDCMTTASKMWKYFEVDPKVVEFPKVYKCKYLHFFAQFQCCFQQLSYLNALTLEPFIPCIVNETYNGTFLYNMYTNLKRRDNPGSYIYQLLQCSPSVLHCFVVIAKFLGFDDCCPLRPDQQITKVGKKPKKTTEEIVPEEPIDSIDNVSEDGDDLYDVNNRFNALNLVDPI